MTLDDVDSTVISVEDDGAVDMKQSGRSTAGTVLAWTLFAAVFARAIWLSATQRLTQVHLVADQASFAMAAQSLARDGDLWISGNDLARWTTLGWTQHPYGLYFQVTDGHAAIAKPYGYPLVVSFFMRIVGQTHAFAMANTFLIVMATIAVMWLLRGRYSWQVTAVVTTAIVGASNIFFYMFPLGVEMFMVALVSWFALAVWRVVQADDDRHRILWGVLAGVLAAGLIAEKQPSALAISPLMVVAVLALRRWWHRVVVAAATLAAYFVAVLPYLHYSGWTSSTPYGGDRFYSVSGLLTGESVQPSTAGDMSSWSTVQHQLMHGWMAKKNAFVYTILGQHIGLLVWFPIAVFAVVLALVQIRSASRYGVAALLGLAAYLAFYIILFPYNSFGGGQSIGNRYFVQISPLIAAIVVGFNLRPRRLVIASIVSIAMVVFITFPQYVVSPRDSLENLDRYGPTQEWFMWETGDIDPASISNHTFPG